MLLHCFRYHNVFCPGVPKTFAPCLLQTNYGGSSKHEASRKWYGGSHSNGHGKHGETPASCRQLSFTSKNCNKGFDVFLRVFYHNRYARSLPQTLSRRSSWKVQEGMNRFELRHEMYFIHTNEMTFECMCAFCFQGHSDHYKHHGGKVSCRLHF